MNKNFFLVPNAVYQMDLSAGAKRIYTYLCYCEDRKTYQCHPSYKTIGENVDMSVNTVRKYVAELVEKRLVATENTYRFNADGLKQNSVLRYTLLPIQNAQATAEKLGAISFPLPSEPPDRPRSPLCAAVCDFKTEDNKNHDHKAKFEPFWGQCKTPKFN